MLTTVRRVDAAFQNVVQGLPADDGVLVGAYASSAHHQVGHDSCGINIRRSFLLLVFVACRQQKQCGGYAQKCLFYNRLIINNLLTAVLFSAA